MVLESWSEFLPAKDPIMVCIRKLKRLKLKLKDWSKQAFRNVFTRLEELQKDLCQLQQRVYNNEIEDIHFQKEKELISEISEILRQQHLLLTQKSHMHWLRDGDRNSEFFHRTLRASRAKSNLSSLMINGVLCEDTKIISTHIQDYYKELFADNGDEAPLHHIRELMQRMIMLEQSRDLTRISSAEEVKKAIFSLSLTSAPGPDGFGGLFFQSSWDTISRDINNAVGFFFSTTLISAGLNSNIVTLIPKFMGASRVEDFRPIVLGNFLFKILSKILSTCLGPILNRILSHSQYGFVPGRKI